MSRIQQIRHFLRHANTGFLLGFLRTTRLRCDSLWQAFRLPASQGRGVDGDGDPDSGLVLGGQGEALGDSPSSSRPSAPLERDNLGAGGEPLHSFLRRAKPNAARPTPSNAKDDGSRYPYPNEYRAWPGPNSNTFTAYIAREVPELSDEVYLLSQGMRARQGPHEFTADSPLEGGGFEPSVPR
jgi:hypothetical protein